MNEAATEGDSWKCREPSAFSWLTSADKNALFRLMWHIYPPDQCGWDYWHILNMSTKPGSIVPVSPEGLRLLLHDFNLISNSAGAVEYFATSYRLPLPHLEIV